MATRYPRLTLALILLLFGLTVGLALGAVTWDFSGLGGGVLHGH